METYTKADSAEYQAQVLIDLAFTAWNEIDLANVDKIILHTSHHMHYIIGTGSNDPQKFDPSVSRETLDHSAMYILAVAMEEGYWRHDESYMPERSGRTETLKLWRKIKTREDPDLERRSHDPAPLKRAFGGRLEVIFSD